MTTSGWRTHAIGPNSPPGVHSLRYRYQTVDFGSFDIHVRSLRDREQFDETDGASALGISSALWPIFGQLWDGGALLADLMAARDTQGLRILEVGCGLGLASLLLNHRNADVSATDRHPSANSFLDHNTDLNGDERIPFGRHSWDDLDTELGLFDLIIGSDLLYEPDAAGALCDFIDHHAEDTCEVVLIDPGRGQMGKMTRQMASRGYEHDKQFVEHRASEQKMRVHTYTRDGEG